MSNAIVYLVSDGTGVVEVKKYIEQTDDDESLQVDQEIESGFVKVCL